MAQTFPLAIQIQAVDTASATLAKVDKRIKSMGDRISKVGAKMTTHLSLPIVGIGVASVASAAEFEKGMASVSTLIDTNTEDINAMSKAVLELGQRVGVPLSDLTTGLYDVRSAGIGAEDAMMVLENSAKLAVAGLGTTKQATRLAAGAINAFQLKGEEAARVYDMIFKTVKGGTTTIAELEQGFGSVAGIVAASNIKLDEYLASVAALTTTTLKAAEVHTQFKAVISGLQAPSKDAQKVFRKLGVKTFEQLMEKAGGFREALVLIRNEVKGDVGALKKITGSVEAVNAILGITGAQGTKAAEVLADMRTGADAAAAAFEKQNKTMSARWQRTKNTLEKAGITIAEVLAPALEKVAAVLATVAEKFSGLDGDTQKFIIGAAAVVAALGPTIAVVGNLVKAYSGLSVAVRVLVTVFTALRAAVAAHPVLLAVTAIATAAYLLYENWEPIKEFFVLLWDGIKAAFAAAWEFIKDIVANVVGAVKTVTDAVQEIAGFTTGAIDIGRLQEQVAARAANRPAITPQRATSIAGAIGSAPPPPAETRVRVEFSNTPKGTRVEQEARGAITELDVGYQMGGL